MSRPKWVPADALDWGWRTRKPRHRPEERRRAPGCEFGRATVDDPGQTFAPGYEIKTLLCPNTGHECCAGLHYYAMDEWDAQLSAVMYHERYVYVYVPKGAEFVIPDHGGHRRRASRLVCARWV